MPASARCASAWCAIVVCLLASVASAQPRASGPQRVEGVAAIVGARTPQSGADIVLLSDVELVARLALAGSDDPSAGDGAPLSPTLVQAALDTILGEILVRREAERVHAPEPPALEVEALRERLVDDAGGEARVAALLARIGADAEELDTIAARRARVDAFLRANLHGATAITDAQVERAYTDEAHPYRDLPVEQAREPLRAWLAMRAMQREVARWIEVLRGRTTVRVLLAPPASAEGARASTGASDVGG